MPCPAGGLFLRRGANEASLIEPPAKRKATLQFGSTKVEVYPDHTMVTFQDGFMVPGTLEDTDDYRATADRFGYGTDTQPLPGATPQSGPVTARSRFRPH
jgi:hypothetical protein